MKATPVVLQPPKFKNSVKTSFAGFRGARIQSGISTAKNPTMWMMRTIPSIIGSFLARKVLKMMQNAVMAITRSVPCHRSGM